MTYQDHINRGKVLLYVILIGVIISLTAASQPEINDGIAASLLGPSSPDSTGQDSSTLQVKFKKPKGGKTDDIHAGADELYANVGYDADGWSLRGYMSSHELRGNHIKDEATKARFKKRKARVQRDFIDSMSAKALDIAIKYNVPPSLIVAQAYIESAYGTSRLAVTANNHFGMQYRGKRRGVKGKIPAKDKDKNGDYQKYDMNLYESTWWDLYHHAATLNGRYAKRVLDADIPIHKRWAAALCGCEDSRLLASDGKKQETVPGGFYYAAACGWKAQDGKTSKYVADIIYFVRLFHLEKLDHQWERQQKDRN